MFVTAARVKLCPGAASWRWTGLQIFIEVHSWAKLNCIMGSVVAIDLPLVVVCKGLLPALRLPILLILLPLEIIIASDWLPDLPFEFLGAVKVDHCEEVVDAVRIVVIFLDIILPISLTLQLCC